MTISCKQCYRELMPPNDKYFMIVMFCNEECLANYILENHTCDVG
jgi:hypothetical protein